MAATCCQCDALPTPLTTGSLNDLKTILEPSHFKRFSKLDTKPGGQDDQYVLVPHIKRVHQVANRLSAAGRKIDMIIGADTAINLDGKIIGKPKSREDAYKTLNSFSGREHEVLSGVCIMLWEGEDWHSFNFHEVTKVKFAHLTPDIINAYIDTGEPMDKAGGYGIQALGGTLVEGIQGDYFNVMGFPLHRFSQHLTKVLEQ
ncbi:unnamed protein product, partial [Meganyctiphanes norvegica]